MLWPRLRLPWSSFGVPIVLHSGNPDLVRLCRHLVVYLLDQIQEVSCWVEGDGSFRFSVLQPGQHTSAAWKVEESPGPFQFALSLGLSLAWWQPSLPGLAGPCPWSPCFLKAGRTGAAVRLDNGDAPCSLPPCLRPSFALVLPVKLGITAFQQSYKHSARRPCILLAPCPLCACPIHRVAGPPLAESHPEGLTPVTL